MLIYSRNTFQEMLPHRVLCLLHPGASCARGGRFIMAIFNAKHAARTASAPPDEELSPPPQHHHHGRIRTCCPRTVNYLALPGECNMNISDEL